MSRCRPAAVKASQGHWAWSLLAGVGLAALGVALLSPWWGTPLASFFLHPGTALVLACASGMSIATTSLALTLEEPDFLPFREQADGTYRVVSYHPLDWLLCCWLLFFLHTLARLLVVVGFERACNAPQAKAVPIFLLAIGLLTLPVVPSAQGIHSLLTYGLALVAQVLV